jgi:hypothetical protein
MPPDEFKNANPGHNDFLFDHDLRTGAVNVKAWGIACREVGYRTFLSIARHPAKDPPPLNVNPAAEASGELFMNSVLVEEGGIPRYRKGPRDDW